MTSRQTDEKITALYERLSRDDELAGDSSSIANQKIYLENYATQHGYTNLRHYTDDGWSGGNFERPDWKRLIADIEAGKIGTVLVKDMSRVGRDYLQTGFYTEVFFREHGVHFIAIANNVDSEDQNSSEFAPFLNIMNEWYLRDQSRKIKAAYKVKGSSGKPTSNIPPYGYLKDPKDINRWLVDEEAAAVVRRIFQMAVEGHGPYDISRRLTADHVDTPSSHLAKLGLGNCRSKIDPDRPYDWYGQSVMNILTRPEYMGHTVNFRTNKRSYKEKRTFNDPADWMIFENTHEAIIDPQTFALAQKVCQTRHRTDTLGEANPLTGLVYCADCGKRMYNHRPKRTLANGKQVIGGDGYNCSSYTLSYLHEQKVCFSHHVSTSALRELILETIRTVSSYAVENEAAFVQKVREASEIRKAESAKELKRKIQKAKRRSKELDSILKKLYESYALEKLPEKRFEALSQEYEQEQAELETLISSEESMLAAYMADTARVEQFLALAKKYRDFTELTTPMIHEFIDRILVHAPTKDEYGERCQEIEIYLNFIGKFEVPVPEPTPEELAQLEADRKRRAANREKYYRRKEREAKKKAETEAKRLAEASDAMITE
ncbi:MAG: DUF4368 domain-containing protein [Oscillospiraceae bacterium]|nr:DUF4368 domain-containing protein [Oscillospiraceae bacterium]MBR4657160.1 DUF4368 domain-containing protein [Oscillospiraceae bacterium]